jgi:hypothetical protein
MEAGTVATVLVIAFTPTAIAAAAIAVPRAVRKAGQAWRRHLASRDPRPAGPPLETVAADLRRLLNEHGRVRRAPAVASRARRLAALEGAITDCALDAARALELPMPVRMGRAPLRHRELEQLLADLADAGVVLPPRSGPAR